ncbi:MAG: hypothetical protein LQ340_002054 [Diploschistes diacapsis]|nr:MAG: hypothetical protein LQ340_002054 [Diploschistes diacapsis]
MQISNNRVAQYPQAKQNVKTAYQSSKNETNFSAGSAIYPWTSGRDANCTATGPCFDYEYHLNGDIVKSFLNLWASTGDYDYMKQNLFDPIQSIATMFSELLQQNGSLYALTNLTDPDEYANHVDNGGFTMPLVANVLETANYFRELVGQSFIPHWETQALNVQTPASGEISLEYEGMNGTIEVKQADVVLKIYPFEVTQNYSLADQLADLDYYAGRQSANGPGMTCISFPAPILYIHNGLT